MNLLKIKVLPHQMKFISASTEWVGMVSGFGAGKTDALVLAALNNLFKFKHLGEKNIHLLIEPTGPMLYDILVPRIKKWLEFLKIPYSFKQKNNEFYIKNYGVFRLRSGENYIRLPGQEVVNSYIDEYDKFETKKDQIEIIDYIVARTRASRETNQKYIVTTPESGREMSNLFPREGVYENKTLIRARTFDNPFLPKHYFDSLKERFDELRLKAYLEGEYIDLLKGRAYYKFSEECIISEINFNFLELSSLFISFDFNVDPMTCIIGFEKSDSEIFIFDEFFKKNSNTSEACEYIIDKYLRFFPKNSRFIKIYGDASGTFRSTTSNLSNYQIIEQLLKQYTTNLKFCVPASNPNVIDRVNIVNNCLEKRILKIFKNCKYLLKDLKEVCFTSDGRNVDKKADPDLTHISDALGYYLSYKFPINIKFNSEVFVNNKKI